MEFDWLNTFFYADLEIIIRLALSIVLGLIIGIEREIFNKPAGLKTQTLVCLGSAIFTILSIYAFEPRMNPDGSFVPADPARIAAQIVTGVGFIGGGVVLKSGINVQGITTAASLWMSAAIGMAVGSGMYSLAIIGTILCVSALIPLSFIERKFFSKIQKKNAKLKVVIHTSPEKLQYTQDYINDNFEDIIEIDIIKSKKRKDTIQIYFVLNVIAVSPSGEVYKKLNNLESYETISVKEISV